MATKMRFKWLTNWTTAAVDFVDFGDVDDDDGRQEEFFKLLSKHNMLPPSGWAEERLEKRKKKVEENISNKEENISNKEESTSNKKENTSKKEENKSTS